MLKNDEIDASNADCPDRFLIIWILNLHLQLQTTL